MFVHHNSGNSHIVVVPGMILSVLSLLFGSFPDTDTTAVELRNGSLAVDAIAAPALALTTAVATPSPDQHR